LERGFETKSVSLKEKFSTRQVKDSILVYLIIPTQTRFQLKCDGNGQTEDYGLRAIHMCSVPFKRIIPGFEESSRILPA